MTGGAAAALASLGAPASAFQAGGGALETYDQTRLSQAVLNSTASAFWRVYNRVRAAGAVTAQDVSTARANLGLLFDHLGEIELTPVLERETLARAQELLSSAPSDAALDEVWLEMDRRGVAVPREELRAHFSRSSSWDKQFALDRIQNEGLQAIVNEAVKSLEGLEYDLRLHAPQPEPRPGPEGPWVPFRRISFVPASGIDCAYLSATIDAFDAAAEGMVHLCLHGIFPACFIAGILILISQMLRVFYYLAC